LNLNKGGKANENDRAGRNETFPRDSRGGDSAMFQSIKWRDFATLPAHQGDEDPEGARRDHRRDRQVLRLPRRGKVGARDSRGKGGRSRAEAGKREEVREREERHQPRRPPAGGREVARSPRGSSTRPHDVERVHAETPSEPAQAHLAGPRKVAELHCRFNHSGARPSGTALF